MFTFCLAYRNISRNFYTKSTLSMNPGIKIRVPINGFLHSSIRSLSSNSHDHSKLWVLEKAVSLGLLAVIPAAFVCQSSILDYALALSLVAHVHWGFEAIVVDYIRPSIFGPTIPKAALGGIYLLSFAALAGLFYLNYSDVGLTTAVRMIAKA